MFQNTQSAMLKKTGGLMSNREMDQPAKRWVVRTAHRNAWRVLSWYDLDDLIADGALCWQIVCTKYPKITERRHLMALFQRTYTNHIHKLANKRTRQSVETTTDDLPDVEMCPESDDTDLRRFAGEQDGATRLLLLTLIDHPELLLRPHRRRLGGRRETTNQFLCSLIKVDPKEFNMAERLHELLAR